MSNESTPGKGRGARAELNRIISEQKVAYELSGDRVDRRREELESLDLTDSQFDVISNYRDALVEHTLMMADEWWRIEAMRARISVESLLHTYEGVLDRRSLFRKIGQSINDQP